MQLQFHTVSEAETRGPEPVERKAAGLCEEAGGSPVQQRRNKGAPCQWRARREQPVLQIMHGCLPPCLPWPGHSNQESPPPAAGVGSCCSAGPPALSCCSNRRVSGRLCRRSTVISKHWKPGCRTWRGGSFTGLARARRRARRGCCPMACLIPATHSSLCQARSSWECSNSRGLPLSSRRC